MLTIKLIMSYAYWHVIFISNEVPIYWFTLFVECPERIA